MASKTLTPGYRKKLRTLSFIKDLTETIYAKKKAVSLTSKLGVRVLNSVHFKISNP